MKKTTFRIFVTALVLLFVALALRGLLTHADEEWDEFIYMPLVMNGYVPPTPTPTATPVSVPPTPTLTPTPKWLQFLTGYDDRKMKGLLTGWDWKETLTDRWGTTWHPMGVFLVIFMDVQNCEPLSGYVSGYDTFLMSSDGVSFFDMTNLDVQWAARDTYGRTTVYETLQPVFIYEMVFVFDVPPGQVYSLWYRPWENGHAFQRVDGFDH